MQDLLTTIQRFYSNTYTDTDKQARGWQGQAQAGAGSGARQGQARNACTTGYEGLCSLQCYSVDCCIHQRFCLSHSPLELTYCLIDLLAVVGKTITVQWLYPPVARTDLC